LLLTCPTLEARPKGVSPSIWLGKGSCPPTTLLLKPKTSSSWFLLLCPFLLNHSMKPPLISPLSQTPTIVGSSGMTLLKTRWVTHLPRPPTPHLDVLHLLPPPFATPQPPMSSPSLPPPLQTPCCHPFYALFVTDARNE
jgi:hypothetical protein